MDLKLVDFEAGQGTFLDTGTTLFFAHSKIYKFSLFYCFTLRTLTFKKENHG